MEFFHQSKTHSFWDGTPYPLFEELPNCSFEGVGREGEARRGEEGLRASSQYQPCLIHRGESGDDHHDDVEPQLDEDDDCNEKHCGSPQNTS